MERAEKSLSFLNTMVRVVFISTFIFTATMIRISYVMNWEMLATTLTERWFTVMVGELIVMGGIQIMKEYVQSKLRIAEIKAMPQYDMEKDAEEVNEREDLSDGI